MFCPSLKLLCIDESTYQVKQTMTEYIVINRHYYSTGNLQNVFQIFQGKFIRIHFGPTGKIAGADIETCKFLSLFAFIE